MRPQVGVLALQGDVYENISALRNAAAKSGRRAQIKKVYTADEIANLDGLVIPGGESTVMGKMSLGDGALEKIREKINAKMPVLGICAGLVLLSGEAHEKTLGKTAQPLLGVLDVKVERNSFGRQRRSFEADVPLEGLGIPSIRGIFIRAPAVSEAGPGVQKLAQYEDKIIAVKQDRILGVAFHPELSGQSALYEYFLKMIDS